MPVIYDRPFRVAAWLVLDLPQKRASDLTERLLAEFEDVYVQAWPAVSFVDTVNELGRRGWSHVVNQPKPFNLDIGFLSVAAARHVKNFFGENTILQGTHDRPYQHAINRRIESNKDYERIFNEVLDLENDTALSQIFATAQPKATVYITGPGANRSLISRLAGKTLTVSETDGNLIVKGKKPDETYDLIVKELQKITTK